MITLVSTLLLLMVGGKRPPSEIQGGEKSGCNCPREAMFRELMSYTQTSSVGMKLRLFFHWWEIIYCGSPKNSQKDQVYAPMTNSFSLNLALKSPGSINEKCCWCRNCCLWSAALLEMWLSFSKTMHQYIALMTLSNFCAVIETPHSAIFSTLLWAVCLKWRLIDWLICV